MSGAISKAASVASDIVNAIKNGLTNAASALASAGRAMIDGMWSGISSAIESLKSKITAGISSITQKVKSVLGISSPSTVYAAIGQNMGAGMGVGFVASMRNVERDMQNAIPTDFNVRGKLAIGADASGSAVGAGTIINQHIAITTPKALSEREITRNLRNMSRQLAMGF